MTTRKASASAKAKAGLSTARTMKPFASVEMTLVWTLP
jgi:hypothetical protein